MSQYIRDLWERDKGFPGGPVNAIAQTPDGYLWIAAEKGLVRFDGLSFAVAARRVNHGTPVRRCSASPPRRTAACGPGCAARRWCAIATAVRGHAADLHQASVVTAMVRRATAPCSGHARARRHGATARHGSRDRAPRHMTRNSLRHLHRRNHRRRRLARHARRRPARVQGRRPRRSWKGSRTEDQLPLRWRERRALDRHRQRRDRAVERHRVTATGVPAGLADVRALALIADRESNIWIAAGSRGLLRVNSRGVTALDAARRAPGRRHGRLRGSRRQPLGRHTRGIERWRDGVFTRYSAARGLPAESAGPVYVDHGGAHLVRPAAGGLYWLRDGVATRHGRSARDDVIYSIPAAATKCGLAGSAAD